MSVTLASKLNPNVALNLRTFLYLGDQAPLESVCKSALNLLNQVPSARHAVFEYLSTLYKVFTLFHLRFNQMMKKESTTNQQQDSSNDLNHINQVLDLIEASLSEIIEQDTENEWSLIIGQWSLSLLGEICSVTGTKFVTEPQHAELLTQEEAQQFLSPTISDGLEIWSVQCKPTQSILLIIQKCLMQKPASIIDQMLHASTKFSTHFDWLLCYFSTLNPELILNKIFAHNLKEFLASSKTSSRLNVVNFFALNFPYLTQNELQNLLTKTNQTSNSLEHINLLNLVLKLSAQSLPLLNIIVNEVLSMSNEFLVDFFMANLSNFKTLSNELFNTIRQINNSVSVFDFSSCVIQWLTNQSFSFNRESEECNIIKTLIVS
jgi:hypothetical protein